MRYPLKIPADISIAGVNDTLEASALNPPLTTVRVFTDQLGKQLAESLMNFLYVLFVYNAWIPR